MARTNSPDDGCVKAIGTVAVYAAGMIIQFWAMAHLFGVPTHVHF